MTNDEDKERLLSADEIARLMKELSGWGDIYNDLVGAIATKRCTFSLIIRSDSYETLTTFRQCQVYPTTSMGSYRAREILFDRLVRKEQTRSLLALNFFGYLESLGGNYGDFIHLGEMGLAMPKSVDFATVDLLREFLFTPVVGLSLEMNSVVGAKNPFSAMTAAYINVMDDETAVYIDVVDDQ